jgi:hypothetical protein
MVRGLQLDRDTRKERMPGATSIWQTPEEGIPGVLDRNTREILIDAIEEGQQRLDDLEGLQAEVALIGTPDEVAASVELRYALVEVLGHLEAFAPFDQTADAVDRCRAARDVFTNYARQSLRSGEPVGPIDKKTSPSGRRYLARWHARTWGHYENMSILRF